MKTQTQSPLDQSGTIVAPQQNNAWPFYQHNMKIPSMSDQHVAYNQAPPPQRYQSSNIPKEYTPIGVSYESALQTLLADDLIVLPEARPYEPQVKPKWWNKKHTCAYHHNRR